MITISILFDPRMSVDCLVSLDPAAPFFLGRGWTALLYNIRMIKDFWDL